MKHGILSLVASILAVLAFTTPASAAPDDIDFPPGTDLWQEFLHQMCELGNQSACDQKDPNYVPKGTTGG